MIRICARATLRSPRFESTPCLLRRTHALRCFSSTQWRKEDPRLSNFGREIVDEFAVMRENYGRFLVAS
jgi:triacylglycerol lipase